MAERPGNRYGRWTVLEEAGLDPYGQPQARVQCKCGTVRVVSCWTMHKGLSQSCGCIRGDQLKARARKNLYQGQMLSYKEIAEREGVHVDTLYKRRKKYGSLERTKTKVE